MRESRIEAHLVRRAREIGATVRKVRWIGRRGAPDRVVMLPRSVTSTVWVELKAPGEKVEPHQAREHKRMREAGQTVVVLDTLDAVDKFIDVRCAIPQ